MNTAGAALLRITTTIRLTAVAQVWFALPWVWHRYSGPKWTAAALAVTLSMAAAASIRLERRTQAPTPLTLLPDLPAGALALSVAPFFLPAQGIAGWAYVGYPYTILLCATFGIALRRLPLALAASGTWATIYLAARWVHWDVFAWHEVIAYVTNPLVTWLLVRLFERTMTETAHATAAAAAQAGLLAAGKERVRQARLLHNHVLQTLETLIRTGAVTDPAHHERLIEDAGWVRDIVSSGHDPDTAEIRQQLLLLAATARKAGLNLRISDAALRQPQAVSHLSAACRRELIDTAQSIVSLAAPTVRQGEVILRVEPEPGGIRLSAVFPSGLPAQAAAGISALAEGATATPDGVAECWIPNHT